MVRLVRISIYVDRMEFYPIGGLVSGVTLNDVLMGISVCRNTKWAKEETHVTAYHNKYVETIYSSNLP